MVVSGGGSMTSGLARAQYAALARMRLQTLMNSLRSRKGKFDLAARIFRVTFFLLVGALIGTGLGAAAYGMAAWSFVVRKGNDLMGDRTQEVAEAARLARRAVKLGADDAAALAGAGYALVFVAHDLDDGSAIFDRALSPSPNLAGALVNSGWTIGLRKVGLPES